MFGVFLYTLFLIAVAFAALHPEMRPQVVQELDETNASQRIEATLLRTAAVHWRLPDGESAATSRGQLSAGTPVMVEGRSGTGQWFWVSQAVGMRGWVQAASVDFSPKDITRLAITLDEGLWLFSVADWGQPRKVTPTAEWNSWQWDPMGDAIWFHRPSRGGSDSEPRLTRMIVSGPREEIIEYDLTGDLLASPDGGAVLVRVANGDIWPLGDVYILDHDGSVHYIARQCDVYFTDSYVPFGRDATWSPDGRYVVLRNSAEPNDRGRCFIEGASLYDRNGLVERNLTDPNSPHRQTWYRIPSFTGQAGADEACSDTPHGLELSDGRNRCGWSPDRQWFVTMPGVVDNPHLGELLIYADDGTLVRRFLIVGWPCNTFQWSPDGRWLVYGGPSGCA